MALPGRPINDPEDRGVFVRLHLKDRDFTPATVPLSRVPVVGEYIEDDGIFDGGVHLRVERVVHFPLNSGDVDAAVWVSEEEE